MTSPTQAEFLRSHRELVAAMHDIRAESGFKGNSFSECAAHVVALLRGRAREKAHLIGELKRLRAELAALKEMS